MPACASRCCFPRDRVARADFAAIAPSYYHRQDMVVSEDNAIAEQQQRGLKTVLARPGRLSAKERIVHALDNWVLDRVLGPAPRALAAVA